MGSNYKAAGFESAKDMYQALTSKDEDKHLAAFTSFILNDKYINRKAGATMTKHEALKNKNWTEFAIGYNGPDYAKNNYDEKMESNYEELKDDDLKGLNSGSDLNSSSLKSIDNECLPNTSIYK